jgi:hypothetical protein
MLTAFAVAINSLKTIVVYVIFLIQKVKSSQNKLPTKVMETKYQIQSNNRIEVKTK